MSTIVEVCPCGARFEFSAWLASGRQRRRARLPADLPRAASKAAEGYQTADNPNEAKERP